MKTPEQRLAALKYHLVFEKLQMGDTYYRISESFDWLFEFGPGTKDWYIHECDDGNYMLTVGDRYAYKKVMRKVTIAFRHRRDAIIYKLIFDL